MNVLELSLRDRRAVLRGELLLDGDYSATILKLLDRPRADRDTAWLIGLSRTFWQPGNCAPPVKVLNAALGTADARTAALPRIVARQVAKWSREREISDLWMEELLKGSRNPLEALALAGLLSRAVVADTGHERAAQVFEAMISPFLKVCAQSDFDVERALDRAFHPLFWTVCHGTLMAKVVPLFERSLKREKRNAVRLFGHLLIKIRPSVDLSPIVDNVLLPTLKAAFGGLDTQTTATRAILNVFAVRIKQPDLLEKSLAVVAQYTSSTVDTDKRLIAALCLRPTEKWSSAMRLKAIHILITWLRGKENNEQVRNAAIQSLLGLVVRADTSCPPELVETLNLAFRSSRAAVLAGMADLASVTWTGHGLSALNFLGQQIASLFSDAKLKYEEAVNASLGLALLSRGQSQNAGHHLLQQGIPHLLAHCPTVFDEGVAQSMQQLGVLTLKQMEQSDPTFLPFLNIFVRACFHCHKLQLMNQAEASWGSAAVRQYLEVPDRAPRGQRLLKSLAKSGKVSNWPSIFLACHKSDGRPCWRSVSKQCPPLAEWHDELLSTLLTVDMEEDVRGSALLTSARLEPRQTFAKAVSFLERLGSEWRLEEISPREFEELAEVQRFQKDQEGRKSAPVEKSSKSKKPDARDKQRLQADLDKAKREAEAYEASRLRYESLLESSGRTAEAITVSRVIVGTVRILCRADPSMASDWSPNLWALLRTVAGFPSIQNECRESTIALCKAAHPPLSRYGWELGCLLYQLCRSTFWGTERPDLTILTKLSGMVQVPTFSGEGMSLLNPLLEDCLTGIDRHEPDVVSAALSIVSLHVKRETWDAATALVKNGACGWLLNVMEREDGLFSSASDSLIDITETAMLVGPNLDSLLSGMSSGKAVVREVTVEALEGLESINMPHCPRHDGLARAIWIGKSDVDVGVAERCVDLWESSGQSLDVSGVVPYTVALTGHTEEDIRVTASRSLARAFGEDSTLSPAYISQILSLLFQRYTDNLSVDSVQHLDRQPDHAEDTWYKRQGVAMALREMATADLLGKLELPVVFTFLCSRGLGDENPDVRSIMVAAAHRAINAIGSEGPQILMAMVEAQLSKSKTFKNDREVTHADRTRESLIVCLGNLASHLPSDDERVRTAILKLVETALNTPSEGVQKAAAECLSKFDNVLSAKDEQTTVDELVQDVFDPASPYGRRRGAAYSLAGLLRSGGFAGLKRYTVIAHIEENLGKKEPKGRLGGLILLETLATLYRKLFEPYVPPLIEHILVNMGDGNEDIRDAAWQASQAMMAELTGQGVRLLLPGLLSGLKERQWRTKAGSAEVLGAMAFCAPRQLAVCLPQVVPKLAESMADAHPKVKASAENAISRIAAVARNPEVRQLAPFLLNALKDPSTKTKGALDAMLGTEFIHAVDPASLALLIPPIHRGLRERETDVKKRAAAIVGSMSSHVANSEDVVPYLSLLLPELQKVLLDPIPDARRTAARALGALATGLSEKDLPGLKSWLVNQMRQPSNTSAERSGAAIGLAEFMGSVSEREFLELLSNLMNESKSKGRTLNDAASEEGLLMLLASLPFTNPEQFEVSLEAALPIILKGLADNSDNVREAALSAGRGCVSVYGKTNIQGLLPLLLGGLRDSFWRIRQSSTQLLGDFLFAIAGHNMSKMELFGASAAVAKDDSSSDSDKEDDHAEGDSDSESDEESDGDAGPLPDVSAEETMKRITTMLGITQRNEVLAALYLARCDVSLRVRQTAIQVWKRVVNNTPRTLRDCLPSIVNQVIDSLAEQDEERRVAGGRALGDLAQKLGDRVLPEVLPVLRRGIESEDAKLRLGSCEGLGELVGEAPTHQLLEYGSELLPAVETALKDSEAEIREAACGVFSSLSKSVGIQQSEKIILGLVQCSSDPAAMEFERACALDGLERVLGSSGSKLLALIVPRLMDSPPLSKSNAIALAAAARVAGASFEVFLSDLVPALVASAGQDSEALSAIESVIESLCRGGDEISKSFLLELVPYTNESDPEKRRVGAQLMGYYAKHGVEVSSLDRLLDSLVRLLADESSRVMECARQALVEVTSHIDLDLLAERIGSLRPMMRLAAAAAEINRADDEAVGIPGLQITKGPGPFVIMFSHGLLHGTPEIREQAALGIAEVVQYSNAKAMGPFVLKLTGALIRVISDRFAWQVKAGILLALHELLESVGTLMRTFLPQLQSTFLKNLADSTRTVRQRSGVALGSLSKVQPRLEPLVKEILNQVTLQSNPANVRVSFCEAMCRVLENAKKIPDSVFQSGKMTLIGALADEEPALRRCLGVAISFLATRMSSSDEVDCLLDDICRPGMTNIESHDQGTAVALKSSLRRIASTDNASNIDISAVMESISWMVHSEYESVREEGVLAAAETFLCSATVDPPLRLIVNLVEDDEALDVRVAALKALARAASVEEMIPIVVEAALEAAVGAAMERNTAIKHGGEVALRQLLLDEYSQERPNLGSVVKRSIQPESVKWLSSSLRKLQNLPYLQNGLNEADA